MTVSLLYLLLAILGLGFLIFIHELGHFWMARRVGMRVETFSIGFGRPIMSFLHNGVKWNICWLPFGGYVKIAGMEKENGKEPDEIEDGFFGKSPWDRIKVALMGPISNLVLAFILFTIIWATGGREKSFGDISNRIGWVDPQSELYRAGIRPGDIIIQYDREEVKGSKDHFHAAMTGGKLIHVKGKRYEPSKKEYVPFELDIHPYAHPQAIDGSILTTGVLNTANFILYPAYAGGAQNDLPKGSPLAGSGIEHGDRIIWMDGEPIHSLSELSQILNEGAAFLTVKRGSQYILRRVPRVAIEELKLRPQEKEELADWQYEADLKNTKFSRLTYIPYNLQPDCVVEGPLEFIENEKNHSGNKQYPYSDAELPLKRGDKIVAVDGTPVESSFQILSHLQSHKVLIVVQKMAKNVLNRLSPEEADRLYDSELHGKNLADITSSIGTSHLVSQKGQLQLLKPVQPKSREAIFQENSNSPQAAELEEEKRQIQAIDDAQKRQQALKFLGLRQKQLLLGLPGVEDLSVDYNPNPVKMFLDVVDEVAETLSALVGGYLNPKWISGPIGIVQVIHHQWMMGIKEAIFWIGAISLNLGLLNLLPLPVLDGGYICLSLFEIVTGRKLKSKTIEKIVIPFAVILISFLLFLTYHDLIRLLSNLVKW